MTYQSLCHQGATSYTYGHKFQGVQMMNCSQDPITSDDGGSPPNYFADTMVYSEYDPQSSPSSFAGSPLASPSSLGYLASLEGAPLPESWQFKHRGDEFWGCYGFHTTGDKGPWFELLSQYSPGEDWPDCILHREAPEDILHRTGSSMRSSGRHVCLGSSCSSGAPGFRRAADLERHLKQVHVKMEKSIFCDYQRCLRSAAHAPNDLRPFGRKDHYRDHLRDYHQEDLPRRHGSSSRRRNSSPARSRVDSEWWRCTKCLERNSVKKYGWSCFRCQGPCEDDRKREREDCTGGKYERNGYRY